MPYVPDIIPPDEVVDDPRVRQALRPGEGLTPS